jgi:phosphoribosylformylglycinamidine synthase
MPEPEDAEPEITDPEISGVAEPEIAEVRAARSRHRLLGMTDEEFGAVIAELGREPTDLELAMYAVMWSEHCSYKSSKVHLRRLPTAAPWVLVGPGEGAGVIDVGDGFAVAVRIESHNHPSAVEPYQGAATGVGGIIRDVFSMGARPIALLDPLRFGPLDDPRTRYLFEGVVAGISGYGNAVGVPTVGGDVVFDDCYRENPLVNVLCLGVLPVERLVTATAERPGTVAILLGSATGRDGIGGASVLASAGFDAGSDAKRPSVQVGDPFEEKRLIECCLELLDARLAVGVQDLGAAGLSCAASETAAKGGCGMDVDVAAVHRREPGMTAVEVMTSESQERMLAIVEPANVEPVLALARKWEIRASVVGRVTDTGRFRVFDGDATEPLADVPAGSLGDGPVYSRPLAPPPDRAEHARDDPRPVLAAKFPPGSDLSGELLALLGSPTIADTTWVSRQYDHMLFLNTVVGPGGDAAVLRLKGTSKALALATDGKAAFCALDPRTGAALAVLEASRNVACSGARPLALVNCLNFGNPEHPEVMWQFSEAIDGLRDACLALDLPVVGGNVSFYNESGGRDIDPTPIVGVVGLVDELSRVPPPAALHRSDAVVVLGSTAAELGGSEWASTLHDLRGGRPPGADLDAAARLHRLVIEVVRGGGVHGIHDASDGGLAVAIAEMAIAGSTGVTLDLAAAPVREACTPAELAFAESANRVVVALEAGVVDAVLGAAAQAGVPAAVIGTAGGDRITAKAAFDVALADATTAWRTTIEASMRGE